METMGKLKLKNVGSFEFHSFEELESMVNDKDSVIRVKMIGDD